MNGPASLACLAIRTTSRAALTQSSCNGSKTAWPVASLTSPPLGCEKEKLAKDLGAHVYIDTAVDDAAAALQRMGGARAILATATSGDAMGPLVSGHSARGKFIVVGVPQDPIQLNAFPLVFGGRSAYGSLTGTPIDSEDTLAFSVLENIRPMIEAVSLEQAANAYARMMQGKARFRMVLVTKDGSSLERTECGLQSSSQATQKKEMSMSSKPKENGSTES